MGKYKKDDVRGIYLEDAVVCSDCMTNEEWNEIDDPNNLIFEGTVENSDDLYFCDRCHKRLNI